MADSVPVTYKISNVTAGFMLAFAVICDLLQFFLGITGILAIGAVLVTFIAEAILGIWFLLLGISFISGKKALTKFSSVLIATIIELVPLLDALPSLTIGVAVTIWASRKEDRETFKEKQKRLPKSQLPGWKEGLQP